MADYHEKRAKEILERENKKQELAMKTLSRSADDGKRPKPKELGKIARQFTHEDLSPSANADEAPADTNGNAGSSDSESLAAASMVEVTVDGHSLHLGFSSCYSESDDDLRDFLDEHYGTDLNNDQAYDAEGDVEEDEDTLTEAETDSDVTVRFDQENNNNHNVGNFTYGIQYDDEDFEYGSEVDEGDYEYDVETDDGIDEVYGDENGHGHEGNDNDGTHVAMNNEGDEDDYNENANDGGMSDNAETVDVDSTKTSVGGSAKLSNKKAGKSDVGKRGGKNGKMGKEEKDGKNEGDDQDESDDLYDDGAGDEDADDADYDADDEDSGQEGDYGARATTKKVDFSKIMRKFDRAHRRIQRRIIKTCMLMRYEIYNAARNGGNFRQDETLPERNSSKNEGEMDQKSP